jgi:hypothetical protein
VVPYEHVRELLGFHKGAPEKVDVPPGMLDGFWRLISGEACNILEFSRNVNVCENVDFKISI